MPVKRSAVFTWLTSIVVGGLLAVPIRAGVVANWIGNSGDWTNAALWSTNPNFPNNGVPSGTNYTAVIANAGSSAYTVTSTHTVAVDGITLNSSNATFSNSGSLTVNGTIDLKAGNFIANGGYINNARFQSEGGTFGLPAFGGPVLSNVQLALPVSMSRYNQLILVNSLNLDGANILMDSGVGSNGVMYGAGIYSTVPGPASLSGTGTITFTGAAYNFIGSQSSGPFTVGSGITINSGTSGGTFGGQSTTITNQGTINVTSGQMTVQAATISNPGTINVSGGRLFLSGNLTSKDLSTINATGGQVIYAGSMDNTGATMDLTKIGRLNLPNGSINGGAIIGGPSASIAVGASPTLSNLSLGVNVIIPINSFCYFNNVQLTNGAEIDLTASSNIIISGISGTGRIVLNGVPNTSGFYSTIVGDLAPNLQLVTGAFVNRYGGYAAFSGGNSGAIISQTPGQIIRLEGNWSNPAGSISATNQGVISVATFPGSFGNFSLNNGMLDIETTLTTPQIKTINANSAVFSVGPHGVLDNSNDVFALTGGEVLSVLGGIFMGGSITGTPTDTVTIVEQGTINGALVSVPISVDPGATLAANGVTLNNANITLNGYGRGQPASLLGSLSGHGSIIFAAGPNQVLTPFTVEPGITVKTSTGNGTMTNVTNHGRILSGTSGNLITLVGSLANTGEIKADAGRVTLSGIISWTNHGVLSIFNGGTVGALSVVFAADSTFEVGSDNGGAPGLLTVSGNLDLSASPALTADFSSGAGGPYEVISYSGTLAGMFVPASPDIVVDYSHPRAIFVTVLPDPASGSAALTAVCVFSLRRRRQKGN